MLTFNHFNFNVSDLDKAIKFYKDALGLEPVRRKEAEDGSFVIVFLGDGKTDFRLELTWLRDHPQKYDLGECEFHLALRADDYDAAASALKTPGWASISSRIRTVIGLRSFQPGENRTEPARRKFAAGGLFLQTQMQRRGVRRWGEGETPFPQ